MSFELVVEDDQASPTVGTIVAQRLVDRKIRAMAGHFNSGVTIPASRIYHDAGIPQLSVSTNVKYTRQGLPRRHFVSWRRTTGRGRRSGSTRSRGSASGAFAVVDDRTAYGQGLADAFAAAVTAAGGQVVKREFTTDKDVDFRALLTAVRGANPDAIFFGGYDAQAGPMARQMKELGMSYAAPRGRDYAHGEVHRARRGRRRKVISPRPRALRSTGDRGRRRSPKSIGGGSATRRGCTRRTSTTA